MKLFDFIFGKKTKLSELDANTKSDDNVYKKQDDKRQKIDTVEPLSLNQTVINVMKMANLLWGYKSVCAQLA